MASTKKDRKLLNIWISPEVYTLLKSFSTDSKVPMNKLIEQAVIQTLTEDATVGFYIKKKSA